MSPIVSRNQARDKGLKRYFTGKPCSKGHVTERYVCDGSCKECMRIKLSIRDSEPERKLAARRRSAAKISTVSGKEYMRDWCLRSRYGINLEQYNAMHREQGGACAVCGLKPHRLYVDHSHQNGEIRGLLCNRCNRAIGLLDDNPQTALKAALYLKEGMQWQKVS